MNAIKIERVGNREYRLYTTIVVSQPINAKTGKAWQATTYHLRNDECKNGLHALQIFNRTIKEAKAKEGK